MNLTSRGTAGGRVRLVWAGVVAGVVVASIAGCSGGPERSVASFCGELDRSGQKLDERTSSAGADVGSQIGMIVENIGDFTAMLHRLDDRAPAEIRSDMDQAVKAWDKQADAIADAQSDPLGALAGTFTNSIMSASSVEAVDRYARDHCNRVIFGSIAASGG
jgi:hypothetical protein